MTEKEYLFDYKKLELVTEVCDVVGDEKSASVILKSTVFHPQGGGQPTDYGEIVLEEGDIKFTVSKVVYSKKDRSIIEHLGSFVGEKVFKSGDKVKCIVNKEKRDLHTFLHSGGHLLDMCVRNMEGYDVWSPGKGFHFPSGAYVEFAMNGKTLAVDDRPQFLKDLQIQIDKLAHSKSTEKVKIEWVAYDDLGQFFPNGIPKYLPKTKIRMVTYGEITHPCEGTHIIDFTDLAGKIVVRKLKKSKKNMRVSYFVKE